MALTPQRRLLNALNDPLLEPLLQQHFRRVFVAELRAFSESVNDFTEKERNLLTGWSAMSVSPRVHKEMLNLGANEHILDVARRVHPTWITAHGHIGDRGVEDLAREIGQCVAAFHHLQDEGKDWAQRYVIGSGFIVVRGPGIQGFSVAVLAGEVFDLRLEDGKR